MIRYCRSRFDAVTGARTRRRHLARRTLRPSSVGFQGGGATGANHEHLQNCLRSGCMRVCRCSRWVQFWRTGANRRQGSGPESDRHGHVAQVRRQGREPPHGQFRSERFGIAVEGSGPAERRAGNHLWQHSTALCGPRSPACCRNLASTGNHHTRFIHQQPTDG